jgi:hypothetical protein
MKRKKNDTDSVIGVGKMQPCQVAMLVESQMCGCDIPVLLEPRWMISLEEGDRISKHQRV